MKKKLFWVSLAIGIIFCLSGCNGGDVAATPNDVAATPKGSPDFGEDVSNTDAPSEPTVQLTAFEELFQYGPMAVQDENELWGYIDNSGEYVIQSIYSSAKSFGENGLAVVKEASNGLWGIISASGNYVVEPTFYGVMGVFSEGLLCVCGEEGWGYVDESGAYVIPPQFLSGHAFSEGVAQVSTRIERVDEFYTYNAYTYIDKSGKLLTNNVFGEAYDFSEGRALVKVGDPIYGYYGYIDTSGGFIIPPQFDEATSFADGMAFAHDVYSNKTVLFDLDGNILAESSLYNVPGSSGHKARWYSNLRPVTLSDGTGAVYINPQGEIVLPKSGAPYGGASPFYSSEFALANQNGMMGFIDLNGNWVIEPQYSITMSSYLNELNPVQMSNSEVIRLLDVSGNCLMEFRTDSKERPSGDMERDPMAMARYADNGSIEQAGFMNHDGSMAIDYIFENASDFAYDYSYARAQSGGLWGMIDKNGNWLIPARFMKFNA